MSSAWLIKDAVVVNEGQAVKADVHVKDGRIAAVGPQLAAGDAQIVDAQGLHLLPGLIDDQVHFRQPGMTHKACIATESAAAVAGGITSYLEMPNTVPPTTDASRLADKLAIAAADSHANYGFYMGANGANAADIAAADSAGACGIKVFLGASTGDLLVEGQPQLEELFAAVPKGMVLAAHCEDAQRIRERQADYIARHGAGLSMNLHPQIRDVKACRDSTQRAIDLAHRHGTRLHVLHLSTQDELGLFGTGPLADKLVTCEACVHHLWFTDADYDRLGAAIKCNPAIKSRADRDALRCALRTGVIDVVATDHAPHLWPEKQGDYADIAAGMPLAGQSLLVLLELVREGLLELADVARLGAHNPADLFGIVDRGRIRAGCFADLALVSLDKQTVVDNETQRQRCGWSPFAGTAFGSRIEAVWVSGERVFHQGELAAKACGQALEFSR